MKKWIGVSLLMCLLLLLMGGISACHPLGKLSKGLTEQRAFSVSEDIIITHTDQDLEAHKKGVNIGDYSPDLITIFLDYEDFPFVENTDEFSDIFPFDPKDGVKLESGIRLKKYVNFKLYPKSEVKIAVFSSHRSIGLSGKDIEFLTEKALLDNTNNLYLIVASQWLQTYRFEGKLIQEDPWYYDYEDKELLKRPFLVDFGGVSQMEPERIAGAPVYVKDGNDYKLVGLVAYKTNFNATVVVPINVVFEQLGVKIVNGFIDLGD